MHVTQQQARGIVAQYEGDDVVIEQFHEFCNDGFRYDINHTQRISSCIIQ